MEYQALYRRWRPGSFADFVGQEHVATTLSNAIANNRIAHAYLFTGPRGTGKTSIAKILAKALNCAESKGFEPCGVCSNCTRISDGIYMDVLEIDAASNRGIDEIRDLREKVKFSPTEGKYKIYIIDEVHMLTPEAFNALLKTLEEPPSFVIFILATTEAHKIPATILSRCQRFDFKRFTTAEIQGRLAQIVKAEKVKASDEALELIATHAEGGMRDAVGLLEQALSHSQGKLETESIRAILGLVDREEIERITAALAARDAREALATLQAVNQDGKDLFQFGRSLIGHLRELLVESLGGKPIPESFSAPRLVEMIETLAAAVNEVKRSQHSALPLELAFIKLASPPSHQGDLEVRIAKLEAALQAAPAPVRSKPEPTGPSPAPLQQVKAAKPAPAAPPQAAPAPVPVAAALNGPPPDFDWAGFLDAVKARKRTLGAFLQEGRPLEYDQQKLVIGFPPRFSFHCENLEKNENKEQVEAFLKEFCGAEIRIQCLLVQEISSAPAEPAGPPQLVKEASALFGGEVRAVPTKEDEAK